MRYVFTVSALCALAVSSCTYGVDDAPGSFEAFPMAQVDDAACVFAAPEKDGILFAIVADDPDHLAYARFKGETLRLVPRVVPDFAGADIDVIYDVLDYPKWQVAASLQSAKGGAEKGDDYSGSLSLLQNNEPTETTTTITGSCGA